jgi:prolipoprotein diacylglyceryltransferase
MHLLIVILIISLIVFLFCLHVLAKEDLIFVRKNITMEMLFNIAFYTIGVGILSARIIYVVEYFSLGFLNPLVFFLFPYFPGLSLVGGVVGATLFILLYKAKKYPSGRIFDFFSMAFLAALPVGFFGQGLLLGMRDRFSGILMPLIFLITLIFFVKVLLPLNTRGEIEDGSLGFLFLVVFSLTTLISVGVRATNIIGLIMQLDVILLIILFIFSLFMLIVKEKHISLRKPKRGAN